MTRENLEDCFPEFFQYMNKCRFVGCAHINEPDCSVKQALDEGKISSERYENYKLMYQELKEKENKYD
jgi:ribosome biogenesis GTPase